MNSAKTLWKIKIVDKFSFLLSKKVKALVAQAHTIDGVAALGETALIALQAHTNLEIQDAVIFDWDMTDNGICNLGILVRKPAWQTERKSGSALISNKTWCWVLAQHPVT